MVKMLNKSYTLGYKLAKLYCTALIYNANFSPQVEYEGFNGIISSK